MQILENLKIWPMFKPSFALNKGVIFIPGGLFWDPFQWHVLRPLYLEPPSVWTNQDDKKGEETWDSVWRDR